MNRLLVRVGVAGVAISAISLFVPMTAADAGSGLSGLRLHPLNATNKSEAGYVASAPASSKVIDHFTVPTIACGQAQQEMAVGAFVGGSAGTSGATVVTVCPGGGSTGGYVALDLVNGGITQATTWSPASGDHMVATVKESLTATTVTIKDVTQQQILTASGPGQTNSLILWGVAPFTTSGVLSTVPTFKNIKLTSATLNGATVSASRGAPVDLEETTVVDIHTGPLSLGKNFTETWKANG
jgi:hypothetical protein